MWDRSCARYITYEYNTPENDCTQLALTAPVVTLKGNQAFSNSRDVAEFFGKQHFNVLRDIRALNMPSNLMASMFSPRKMPDAYGRMGDTFDMTKDGFTLLAMGFTGAKALQFKLACIAAFNELEAKANDAMMALPDFTNPAAAARAWADELWTDHLGAGRSIAADFWEVQVQDEHLKYLSEFLSELKNESDRGLALASAAFLDDILKRSLHSLMRGNESTNEQNLLHSGGPIGDATVRLNLCLALGIISYDEHHELSNVYKIRNKFAHRVSYKSFDNGGDTAISDLVANLRQGAPLGTGSSRRSRFETSVTVLALLLWYRPDWVQKVRVQEPLFSRIEQATKLQGAHPMGATKPE